MIDRDMRRATVLIMALFFFQPMILGAWFALIPTVKEALELSKAELAVALLGMPISVLIALQVAGAATSRLGVRHVMAYFLPLQVAAGLLPLIADGQATLFLALMGFGASVAIFEVAMNVYAGRVEKAGGVLVMNRCHGFWALGMMSGALLTATLAATFSPIAVMAAIGVASGGLGFVAVRGMPRIREDADGVPPPKRRLAQVPAALIAIGIYMLLVTFVEAAMTDWSAVYLAERLGLAGEGALARAGIAVTIFAGFMAAGRFAGDYLKRRFGALVLARGSVGMALLGLACLVLPLPVAAAYVGFACVGLGVAAGYPLGVSAVSALDDRYEASNVAIMSTFALTGFLFGPPVMGFLGEAFGMRAAFAALIPGLLACLVLARWLESRGEGAESAGNGLTPGESRR